MKRYLMDFDLKNMTTEYHDVVIVGSGIAGVYTALEIPENYDVAILTKETLEISNSVLAQGGIAVSLDKEDSPKLHFNDTIYAGAGLCNEESVWVLVNEAAKNIEKLCIWGVEFDKKNTDELALTREGAHSKNRIIHAGDTTGKEVCDKLISVVRDKANVSIKERTFALDLVTQNNSCVGLITYDEDSGKYIFYQSNMIICATGGFGQIYSNTTNPAVSTGDGVCMAYRAGAELMDLEFIQFHPTVLYHEKDKSFLISEAVRGEGAVLRNSYGERFMSNYHELGELAPRDIVSRAIFAEMKRTGSENVYLDITFKDKDYLENRFPNIYKTCLDYGIDMSKDFIPVAPAEHYCMGGIKTDIYGRTNINGFYACGEAACTGIHGANRLASNSLLEGLVFGKKISNEVDNVLSDMNKKKNIIDIKYVSERKKADIDKEFVKKQVRLEMNDNVGIIRDKSRLENVKEIVEKYIDDLRYNKNTTVDEFELENILLISKLVIESALERQESRGAHYRTDFSSTEDVWKRNIIKRRDLT